MNQSEHEANIYDTKWRRAGNFTPKMADTCIQFFRTLEHVTNLF